MHYTGSVIVTPANGEAHIYAHTLMALTPEEAYAAPRKIRESIARMLIEGDDIWDAHVGRLTITTKAADFATRHTQWF